MIHVTWLSCDFHKTINFETHIWYCSHTLLSLGIHNAYLWIMHTPSWSWKSLEKVSVYNVHKPFEKNPIWKRAKYIVLVYNSCKIKKIYVKSSALYIGHYSNLNIANNIIWLFLILILKKWYSVFILSLILISFLMSILWINLYN